MTILDHYTDGCRGSGRRSDVIATPHIGYVTSEDLAAQFSSVFAQVITYAAGESTTVVNPDARE